MIREYKDDNRQAVDKLQYKLQKYFSEIDKTGELKVYESFEKVHLYLEQMIKRCREYEWKNICSRRKLKSISLAKNVTVRDCQFLTIIMR